MAKKKKKIPVNVDREKSLFTLLFFF